MNVVRANPGERKKNADWPIQFPEPVGILPVNYSNVIRPPDRNNNDGNRSKHQSASAEGRPKFPERAGLLSKNFSIVHLSTARRNENIALQGPSTTTDVNKLSTDLSRAIFSSASLNRMKTGYRTSSSVLPKTTATDTSGSNKRTRYDATDKNEGNESSSSNAPNSKLSFTAGKSSNSSLHRTYPQLFRNVTKSGSKFRTPVETPNRTSSKSSSRSAGKSRTPTSVHQVSHVILAVAEGRGQARGEVGIAAMDTGSPHLVLCQISDTQLYRSTLIKINVLNPMEIVVPHTFCEGSSMSKLYISIRDAFPAVTLTQVHRRHFNDDRGLQQIKRLCAVEYTSVEMLVVHKFYALCAAAALIKYVEHVQNTMFVANTLKVEYHGSPVSTVIDVDSANRLELVRSLKGSGVRNSLLGILNSCRTQGGTRMLRANILQPPCTLDIISVRYECVQEIVNKPDMIQNLQSVLQKLSSVNRLLALCMHTPQQDHLKAAETQMNYVLLLKTSLEQISVLSVILENAESKFLHSVYEDLQNPVYKTILQRILETVHDDAHVSKSYVAAHHQRCFAIKPGINGLLDVARKTYSELVEDMLSMVQELAESYNLPLTLKCNAVRGFHIQLSSTNRKKFKINELPELFIQAQERGNTITLTTQQLLHIDERCKEVRNEIQMMSNVVVFKLLNDIRDNIGCLYSLCENIAEVDMLLSFAKISSLPNFVLPTFGDVLDVKDSRHPVMDFINPTEPVANNIFSSVEHNFHVITGPNMSGKSIYIRQIVLLQIMAQLGCYVPAAEAQFRITDRIFTRISFDDSIECNASTFVLEVRELKYIMQTITPNSLIIIDELGRGTSSEEGTAVAWAFSENLLQNNAFIFLTTHFMLLTKLESLYHNVTNLHFQVIVEAAKSENKENFSYTHKLLPGPTQLENYGLHLAQVLSMPDSIVERAKILAKDLSVHRKVAPTVSVSTNANDDQCSVLLSELISLLRKGILNRKNCFELKNKLFPEKMSENDIITINEISSQKEEGNGNSQGPDSTRSKSRDEESSQIFYEVMEIDNNNDENLNEESLSAENIANNFMNDSNVNNDNTANYASGGNQTDTNNHHYDNVEEEEEQEERVDEDEHIEESGSVGNGESSEANEININDANTYRINNESGKETDTDLDMSDVDIIYSDSEL